MMTNKVKWTTFGLIGLLALNGCNTDGDQGIDPSGENGSLRMEVTDAPVDEASVKGVFVTVTEVKLDGKKWEAFQGPKTVNLLELQGGKTATLSEGNIGAGSFNQITFVLNHERDASGNAPGCYVLRQDNSKNRLDVSGSATTEFVVKGSTFDVPEGQPQSMVVDFDLRKAIKAQSNSGSSYAFVTKGELESSVRYVKKDKAGTINGKLTNYNESVNGKAVAYVYAKGSFNQNTETKGQGSSDIQFKNCVTSAKVNADGSFTAAFLNEGDYELHVATYRQESSGKLTLNAFLDLGSSANLNTISVKANTQTSLSVSIKGILGAIL